MTTPPNDEPQPVLANVPACEGCGKASGLKLTRGGNPRLPRGWKWHHNEAGELICFCSDCWRQRYKLRAVTFPVAEVLNGEWKEFTDALKACWGLSTSLANWAVNELAKADTPRLPGDEKLAAMPKVGLYQLWQQHHQRSAWTGAAQSANCLLRGVELKYRSQRLDVVWRNKAVLPRYRYPVPYPVHNATWEPSYQEYTGTDGQVSKVPSVSVPLGSKRFLVRLRGGYERARQLAAFAKIISGEAIRGELALYRVRGSLGDHRSSVSERHPGGGARVSYRIMCKLVAWLPGGERVKDRSGTLEVKTASNALWVAFAEGRENPWMLKANYVRRWIMAHRWKLQAIATDTKAERRRPKKRRLQLNEYLDKITHRQRNRLDTFCHTAAKMLAFFAHRQNVAEVVYDDRNKKYFQGEFPYFKLAGLLKQKLDEFGIVFRQAASDTNGSAESESNGDDDGNGSASGTS
jgi:hypothetical protein